MRSIVAASIAFVVALALALSGLAPPTQAQQQASLSRPGEGRHLDGQAIFRFDTFGDEQLWTDTLRMHEVLPNVDPATALAVGLKVDVEALPQVSHYRAREWSGRSHESRGDRRTPASECRRGREGNR